MDDSRRARMILAESSRELPRERRLNKRQRVSLACQRCKSRKQKCNGEQPICVQCKKAGTDCQYVMPPVKNVSEQKRYVRALEERVAELESGLSYGGRIGVDDDHWERLRPSEDGYNALSGAIRDLSLNASGYYVGATTHISLGRMLGLALQAGRPSKPSAATEASVAAPHASGPWIAQQSGRPKIPRVLLLARPEADTLFQAYMRFVACQCPIIYSKRLRNIHANREKLEDLWEAATLHFVYAIGGRSLELTGQSGNYLSDVHYEAAMECKESIIQYNDRRSIIFLLMATLFCLRAPRAQGPWLMLSLAMKFCISIGLHRKSASQPLCLADELDKRLFWSCYNLDRDVAISTGRPVNIADFDIDIALPLDIDEDAGSFEEFRKAARQSADMPANPPTSLTEFLHTTRLKRIQSEIAQAIYRVDRPMDSSPELIEGLLEKLVRWQQSTPADNSRPVQDLCMIQYSLSVRLVLFPLLSENPVNPRYLKLCSEACAKVCETYKRLHNDSNSLSYTPLATQWLFLSGLTLVFCIWHSPSLTLVSSSMSAVYSCSTMLYIMTERWAAAARYRDAFEGVKDSVLELVSSHSEGPRSYVGGVSARARSALDMQDPILLGSSTGPAGFGQMMNDIMAGSPTQLRPQSGGEAGWGENDWNVSTDNLAIASAEMQSMAGAAPGNLPSSSMSDDEHMNWHVPIGLPNIPGWGLS